jgi:predicted amidohydrolase YtcJ
MLIIQDADIGGPRADVAVDRGRIVAVEPGLPVPAGAEVVAARGGGLLPGLHDHHLHLLAMAAARRSTMVGPPAVRTPGELAEALGAAASGQGRGEWVRAVGYHESVAGFLDRDDLDRLVRDHPLRLQHRSGVMWVLNSVAVERVGLDTLDRPGIERDAGGRPTGRLYGLDEWLRDVVAGPPPSLAPVGAELIRYGITGVTDATPTERAGDAELLAEAVRRGDLPLRVRLTGGLGLDPAAGPALERGPVKLVLSDHQLPGLADLSAAMAAGHDAGRPVALHCVTRAALVLALAAWDDVGARPGDRLEHGAVVPPDQAARLADLGITVVTQPAMIRDRGDAYLTDVEPHDLPHLWPCRSLLDSGVTVAGSSDAPFGHPDPWRAVHAAVTRRTEGGVVLGEHERLSPAAALALYLAPLESPAGPPRRIAIDTHADLVLLHLPLEDALHQPSADLVAATIVGGAVVWSDDELLHRRA